MSWSLSRLFCFALLAAFACTIGCKESPHTTGEAMVLMDEYRAHQRYDDALRVARKWLDEHPDDGLMHAYIAVVYLQKVRTAPSNDTGLIEEAVRQTYKAVELDPDDLTAMRLAIITLEEAAKMSEQDRCKRYGDASRLIAHLMKSLKAEFENGERVRSRRDLEAAQLRVRQKAIAAGCTEK